MIGAMRATNLEPPRFNDRRTSFLVTLRNLTMMNADALAWLSCFADIPLNDRQRLALVYLRHNRQIANFDYQRLTHVDSVTATKELRGLVQAGLILPHSTRRWAHYTLNAPAEEIVQGVSTRTPEDIVLDYVREHGHIKRSECMALLGITDLQAKKLLARMRGKQLRQEGVRRGAKYLLLDHNWSITGP